MLTRVCVFCGSSVGARQTYVEAARALGREMGGRGIGLVYGGAKVGLMGALADACLAAGGSVAGVIPRQLVDKEVAHRGLTELHLVESMHERKSTMASLCDSFIMLPGGFGTWEEFFEVLTWSQLGLQTKPCGLLNVEGYFDPLLAMVRHAVAEGFVKQAHRDLIVSSANIGELLDQLAQHEVPYTPKWIAEADV